MCSIKENILGAIVAIDEEGTIVSQNKNFVKKYGTPINIKERLIKTDKDIFFNNLIMSVKQKKPYKNFMHMFDLNGILIECYINVFRNDDNFVCEIIDMREIQSKNILNKQLGEFFNSMTIGFAHSMRNPVMAMGGMVNRIKSKMPSEYVNEIKPYIEAMDASLKRIMKVIFDIETLNRSFDMPLESVDVGKIINEVVQKNKSKNIVYELHFNDDIFIFFNRAHLLFIIEEIIKNAIEAIDYSGIIKINISKINNIANVEIMDNGKGINDDEHALIFVPFFSTKPDNVGLGLSLVKFLLDCYNSTLNIQSFSNMGTTITINMPLEKRNSFRLRNIYK